MTPKTEAERAAEEFYQRTKWVPTEWGTIMFLGGFHACEKSERVMKLVEALKYISKNAHEMDRHTAKKALAEFEGEE